MGLGILCGGVNTAKWLIKQSVELTISDLKIKRQLKKSLDLLKQYKIEFVLGKHRKKDFLDNDIIVVNPDVPVNNKYLKLAQKNNKQIENELTLFNKFIRQENIISVTGTRGKTTTVNWVTCLLRAKFPQAQALGNSSESPLLKALVLNKQTPVVLECPSFLLEYAFNSKFSPKIAVITNIYRDHLNRYKDIEEYIKTKANIFSNQNRDDILILNYNNLWTNFFLKQKPRAQVLFFSTRQLPVKMNGVFVKDKYRIYFRENKKERFIFDAQSFVYKWGEHNLENLLPAIICAIKYKISIKNIIKSIKNLPSIKFRQELVYKDKNLRVYNDTCATSPEATIAALKKFSQKKNNLILITGGTDRNLDYTEWAKEIKKYLSKKNIIFLKGSATKKMIKALEWDKVIQVDKLEECIKIALSKRQSQGGNIILFSPSSKSFEKFKNEFDRGEKFNRLIKKYTRRKL